MGKGYEVRMWLLFQYSKQTTVVIHMKARHNYNGESICCKLDYAELSIKCNLRLWPEDGSINVVFIKQLPKLTPLY